MHGSYENNGNLSHDRQGGVDPVDCLNRSLTVAARYRIFMPCGAALGAAWSTPPESWRNDWIYGREISLRRSKRKIGAFHRPPGLMKAMGSILPVLFFL